jgi:hypothetical protein
MTAKIRKQIYIEPDQNAVIKRLSNESGMAEAEIIRQAINQHVQALRTPKRDLGAWEAERTFIMRLIHQGAVAGNRTWKRDELYER